MRHVLLALLICGYNVFSQPADGVTIVDATEDAVSSNAPQTNTTADADEMRLIDAERRVLDAEKRAFEAERRAFEVEMRNVRSAPADSLPSPPKKGLVAMKQGEYSVNLRIGYNRYEDNGLYGVGQPWYDNQFGWVQPAFQYDETFKGMHFGIGANGFLYIDSKNAIGLGIGIGYVNVSAGIRQAGWAPFIVGRLDTDGIEFEMASASIFLTPMYRLGTHQIHAGMSFTISIPAFASIAVKKYGQQIENESVDAETQLSIGLSGRYKYIGGGIDIALGDDSYFGVGGSGFVPIYSNIEIVLSVNLYRYSDKYNSYGSYNNRELTYSLGVNYLF